MLLLQVLVSKEAQRSRNWLIFAGMALGYSVSIIDTTITQVALPSISQQLHADLTTTGWIVHVYNAVFVICLVAAGRLADLFGRKRLFLSGLSLFAASSLACALSPSIAWLILFRGLQAVGGACLGSVGFAIVSSIFVETQQRTRALRIWSALAATSAIAGPILGGLIVTLSWHWIFLINLLPCLIGFVLTQAFLPVPSTSKQVIHFDVPGMLFLAGALVCLTLVLVEGSVWGLSAVLVLGLWFLVSLGSFLLVEQKSHAPLVSLALFRLRSFSASCAGMFLFWTAYQGASIVLSLYFQISQGRTPEQTAFLLLPVPLANVLTSLFFTVSWPTWVRAAVGMGCGVLGFLLLALMGASPVWFVPLLASVLIGMGAAFCFISFHVLVVSDVEEAQLGQASGVFNLCRQLATMVGAALLMSSMRLQLQGGLIVLERTIAGFLQTAQDLPFPLRQQAASRLVELFQHVLASGGMGQQSVSLFAPSAMGPWNRWLSVQLQVVVANAFEKTWIVSVCCAGMALLTLPFLRKKEH